MARRTPDPWNLLGALEDWPHEIPLDLSEIESAFDKLGAIIEGERPGKTSNGAKRE